MPEFDPLRLLPNSRNEIMKKVLNATTKETRMKKDTAQLAQENYDRIKAAAERSAAQDGRVVPCFIEREDGTSETIPIRSTGPDNISVGEA